MYSSVVVELFALNDQIFVRSRGRQFISPPRIAGPMICDIESKHLSAESFEPTKQENPRVQHCLREGLFSL
jgi:hypothetical protein